MTDYQVAVRDGILLRTVYFIVKAESVDQAKVLAMSTLPDMRAMWVTNVKPYEPGDEGMRTYK